MRSLKVLRVVLWAPLLTVAALAQMNPNNMGKMMQKKSPEHCQQMMADSKAMDESLAKSLAAMNAAQGNAKIDAMAAVINQMAAQRSQMMAKMEQCPMMNTAKGKDEKPADPHKDHH